jgi:predicted nucleic acid-binding protein
MSLLLDTGILVAAHDRSDAWHQRAVTLLRRESAALVVPAPVIPEVDHLLGKRIGSAARRAFLADLSAGVYYVSDLSPDGYARVVEIERRFAELELGFVDSAIVAIAEQLDLRRIATTDRRDFEPLAAALGFSLFP